MKKNSLLMTSILSLSLAFNTGLSGQNSPRSRVSFNEGWKFARFDFASSENETTGREPLDLQLPSFDDKGWRSLDLPHDWGIEGPFDDNIDNETGMLPWRGIGWYRKHFNVDQADQGKRFYIDFDGAMANAKVWLNGKYVGTWPYGYTSFRLDLTPYVSIGRENVIALRLDTKNWGSRWYPGAGIYRNVWLIKTSQLHISHNGIFCTTPEVKNERGILSVKAELESHFGEALSVSVKVTVYKIDGQGNTRMPAVAESPFVTATVRAEGNHDLRLDIPVKNPVLWDIGNPELYKAVVTVMNGDAVADVCESDFGFRTINFTPRDGLLLNGKRVELRGVCNHHDLGALGSAFNISAAARQLRILKEMGCNAIRTSHNPPAPELVDLCDRMGFMMEVEAFDTWRTGKKDNDYSAIFDTWHAEDLKTMVRAYRSHPSVILWSIGNEVPDQMNPYLSESLRTIVKSQDNTRPVTSGCNFPNSGTNGFQKTLDVFGINYNLLQYQKFFALKDNACMGIHSSESASTVSSRGEYYFPVVTGDLNNHLPGKGIFQVTSYDVAYPAWATTADQQWTMLDKFPATYGEFVWTGFDYIGEPTPYYDLSGVKPGSWGYNETKKMLEFLGTTEVPSRSSYFGIVDLAGFPKDRYYLYQSHWRPDLPMAHILPHWNWPERKGIITPVHVYTSGDEAELFLNGKSLGRKHKGQYEYRLVWDNVVYQPGELMVVAYKNGQKWAEDIMTTTAKAAQLSVSADRAAIRSDGSDLAFITVRIEDKNKLLVPRSSNLVNFSITGPGKIVVVDNGDATSHDPFQASSRKAYNGLCLVIVKAEKGATGSFTLKAESKGLKGSTVVIATEK